MHTHNSGVHKHDLKSWKIHCLRSISTAAFFQPYRQVTESPQEFFPHHFSATALVKVTSYIHVAKPIDYYSVFISMNNSKTSGRVNHSLPVFSNIASLPPQSPVSPQVCPLLLWLFLARILRCHLLHYSITKYWLHLLSDWLLSKWLLSISLSPIYMMVTA